VGVLKFCWTKPQSGEEEPGEAEDWEKGKGLTWELGQGRGAKRSLLLPSWSRKKSLTRGPLTRPRTGPVDSPAQGEEGKSAWYLSPEEGQIREITKPISALVRI
jgi:hypothetical protein